MKISVIGNGLIGHGVAETFATSGYEVALIGRSEQSLAASIAKIRASIEEFARNGLLSTESIDATMRRISTTVDLNTAAASDFIVEALPEGMALKHATLRELERICRPDAVFASASGHPASNLDPGLLHPERLISTHFWYPPQLLPCVEVCPGPKTSAKVTEQTCDILRAAGKEPVIVEAEIYGFVGNRIQFAIMREAWAMWADGVASAEAIDAVVRTSIGRRYAVTGPIESGDLAGLHTMAAFAAKVWPSLSTETEPRREVMELASKPGGTIHRRTSEEWENLRTERQAELLRWLANDRKGRVP